MLSSSATLRRSHAHLAHLLEDWSREAENEVLADLAANFDAPARRPAIPPIERLDLASRILFRLTAIDKTLNAAPNPIAPPMPPPAIPAPSASSDSLCADWFGVQASACPIAPPALGPLGPLGPFSPSPDSPNPPALPAPLSRADCLPPFAEGVNPADYITGTTPEDFTLAQSRAHQWALENPEHAVARSFFIQHLQLAPPDFRLPDFMTDPRWQDRDWAEAELDRRAAALANTAPSASQSAPKTIHSSPFTLQPSSSPASTRSTSSTQSTPTDAQAPGPSDSSSLSASADTSLHPASAGVHAPNMVPSAGLSRLSCIIPSVPSVPCVPTLPSLAIPQTLTAIAAATEDLFSKTQQYAASHNLPLPAPVPDDADSPDDPISPISLGTPISRSASSPTPPAPSPTPPSGHPTPYVLQTRPRLPNPPY